MSETYRQHLRAVIANPDADEPRLELATLVRGQDPDRARFIELQVEAGRKRRLERAMRGAASRSTEDRALLRRHGTRWAHTMAKYTARQEFDRGFIAEIAIEPSTFLEYGDWLLKNEPIRMVWFGAAQEGPFPLGELFDSPLLERLDAIALVNQGLSDRDVEVIAASAHLGRLLCLDLGDNPLTGRAFAALAAAPDTRKLLAVGGSPGGHGEVRALERQHGYIPWLHPRENGCDWLDARYYVDQGRLPFRVPGSTEPPPPPAEPPRPPPPLQGQAAIDLLERLHRQNLERRARALAEARAEADRRGKEPFDLDALEKLCNTSSEGRLAPAGSRHERFEYLYYVEHPRLMTIAELAKLVAQLDRW